MNDATWALVGVLVGTVGAGFFNWLLQSKQFKHNKEMFLLQNQSAPIVKALLFEMLNHESHIDRSFEALRAPIGGYTDDQIRLFLHELKAKKVKREEDGSEWWYLVSRQADRSARREAANAKTAEGAPRVP